MRDAAVPEADAEEALFQIRKRHIFFRAALNAVPTRLELLRFAMERAINKSVAAVLMFFVTSFIAIPPSKTCRCRSAPLPSRDIRC